jgi:RHS repeat-associated protein
VSLSAWLRRTIRFARYLLFLSIPLLSLSPLCEVSVFAQDPPNVEQGTNQVSVYHGSNIDLVDLVTGRLNLHIPLVVDRSQRGNLNFTYSLYFSGQTWYQQPHCTSSCTYSWNLVKGTLEGVTYGTDGYLNGVSTQRCTIQACGFNASVDVASSQEGRSYHLGTITASPLIEESIDGSGIHRTNNPSFYPVLTNKDGTQFSMTSFNINTGAFTKLVEDANGNELTFQGNAVTSSLTTMTDTVGRTWTWTTGSTNVGGCPVAAVNSTLWDIPGPGNINNGVREFKFCYSNISIQTHFGQGATEYSATWQVITGVVLPDGTTWRFDYNSYGDPSVIYLPTGGTITYQWRASDPCSTGDRLEVVSQRTLFDGTNSNTWYYNTVGGYIGGVRVTDPLGNDTVYNPTPVTAPYGSGGCSRGTGKIQYYAGSYTNGTLLKTVTNAYQTLPDPYLGDIQQGGAEPILLTSTTTTWGSNPTSGQTNQIQQTYDSGFTFTDTNSQGYHGTYQSVYGLVTQEKDYDYGSGAPGTLLTQKYTYYMATSYGGSYLSGNLLDLITQQSTYGSVGSSFVTYYGYDASPTVSSGVTVQHTSPPGAVMGNLTSIVQWDSATSTNVTVATYTNYDTGMRATSTDALNQTTHYYYANQNPNWYGSRLTTVTNALGQSTNYSYDWPSGLLAYSQDLNGNWTNYVYDSMFRPTQINYPDGGQTNFTYSSYNGFMYTLEQRKIDRSRWVSRYKQYDGLGRAFRSAMWNDESPSYDQVDTCFDARGNVGFQSYPYRGTGLNASPVCSGAGDTFSYDALNRVTQVTHPDSQIVTSYAGRATQVRAEGNNSYWPTRISQVDGLGRVSSVCEVSSQTQLGSGGTPSACGQDIAGTGFLTTYQYDAMNNLVSVSQGGYASRSFNYDAMNRLISASNPESGTTSYSYRTSGGAFCAGDLSLPCTRTDARGVSTTYSYDTLNRLSLKSYSDGTPSAGYSYDFSQTWGLTLTNTVGRLAEIYTYSAAQGYTAALFSYDSMGRQTYGYTCLPITCWSNTGGNFVQGQGYATLTYGHDFVGDMTSSTNGEGVTLIYAYNQAQRLTGITSSLSDSNHPGTLFSAAHYSAAGSLTSASLDNAVIGETRSYDGRMRLSSISDTVSGNTLYSLTAGYALDGDVWEVNDSVIGNWTYGFDAFNRLSAANGPNQGYTYAYDRFGNRWQQNGTHQMIESFSGNNNRMDGYSYDAAGNLLSDGTTTYTYDAENRIISATNGANGTTTYIYDADGKRLRKTANGVVTDYLYDSNGHQIAAVNGSGAWVRGEVYGARRHLATYKGGTSGNIYFTFADHLGTERVRATVGGTVAESCTSLPFGDWLTCTGSDSSPMHFTAKERDSESGLDYFGARYYSSQLGRFTSADPSLKSGLASSPQSWNRYAYTMNNPLGYVDTNGKCTAPAGIGPGQVGICIDAYIAARSLYHGLGLGDNRGPMANGGTFRYQFQAIIDPGNPNDPIVNAQGEAGVSRSVLQVPTVLGTFNLSNPGTQQTDVTPAAFDSQGNISFTVSASAYNGFAGIPFVPAPQDPILLNVGLVVSPDGTVNVQGGDRSAYPSLEGYYYDSNGVATAIPGLQLPETNENDLGSLNQIIAPPTDTSRSCQDDDVSCQ